MAGISIHINDSEYSSATAAQSDLRASANGPQHLLHLSDWLKKRSASGSLVGRIHVGSANMVRAVGTLTLSGNPSADETMVLGAFTLTAKNSGATGLQYNIGANAAATTVAIAALINTHATLSTLFSATSTATTVVVTCLTPGLIGNSVAFTESMSNTTINGSGYLGGTTAGAGQDDSAPIAFAGQNGGTTF